MKPRLHSIITARQKFERKPLERSQSWDETRKKEKDVGVRECA
jgi:hypothetical protein